MQKTERIWMTPGLMKDIYFTMQVDRGADGGVAAAAYAMFEPRIPVVSHILTPAFKWMMRRDLKTNMAALKEYCETGKVSGRPGA
jgi:hypothetical protein